MSGNTTELRNSPWNDTPTNADRFTASVAKIVSIDRNCFTLDLVRPAREVLELGDGEKDVRGCSILSFSSERLAVVQCFEFFEVILVTLHEFSKFQ